MTIDQFEIGEKYFYGDSEFFCVDKGTKGVTLALNDDDLDDSASWFVIGVSEFDDCAPIKGARKRPREGARDQQETDCLLVHEYREHFEKTLGGNLRNPIEDRPHQKEMPMTLDEFKIGEKCLYCNSEFLCVDKGTKSIVLTQANNDPESTYHWFAVAESDFDDCEPIVELGTEDVADEERTAELQAIKSKHETLGAIYVISAIETKLEELKRTCS